MKTLTSSGHAFTCIFVSALGIFLLLGGCGKGEKNTATSDSSVISMVDSNGMPIPANLEKSKEPVVLRMKFVKGETFGYSISTTERVKLTRDTLVETSLQELEYRYKFDVLETHPDGTAKLKATLLRVRFSHKYEASGKKNAMKFDSDEKIDKQQQKVFAQYSAPVRTPFTIEVDKEGRITSVTDIEEIIKRLMQEDYNTTEFKTKKLIERQYGESTLKNVIQLAFQKLENKQLRVDSSWYLNWTGNQGYLKLENKAKYTLQGFENTSAGRLAHIVVKMKSDYLGERKIDTGQGMATVDHFDITGSGTSTFNMDTGRSQSRKLHQNVSLKFFVEVPTELKQMAPDQAKDFWMVQNATVENVIEPLTF